MSDTNTNTNANSNPPTVLRDGRTLPGLPYPLYDTLLECARGRYQRNLLVGLEAWSGASLRGAAKSWSTRYGISRGNLISRLEKAGFCPCFEFERRHGKKILTVEIEGVTYAV